MGFSSIEQKELMCIIPQSSWEILSTALISCSLLRSAMDSQSSTWLLIILYCQDKPSPQQKTTLIVVKVYFNLYTLMRQQSFL